ncbi:protein MAINTENANCE OF PSII UNDER HIGH LIGHT 1 [Quercus lobata]|uniref:Proline-rich family protein n=1 Tax=Quercus lobata TaxID=97700 RepID=A0A7N2R2P8_QUELO|nr:protein MAINTENANCE OF PSII UNDER HIGH LIGHT 1 [Quercus lobata]
MACALQAVVAAANTCTFPTQRFFNTKYHSVSKRSSSLFFRVRASTEEDPDCNDEECAPDKEVGKISGEWLAGEKTRVVGTYPPRKKGWTGYVEKDTAGQTNIYSVEPTVYVAESAISSGNAGKSADGAENSAAIAGGLALISIAAASSILLQVGKNKPPQMKTIEYSGPSLTYYINKFKPQEMIEASVPSQAESSSSVQVDSSAEEVPQIQVNSAPDLLEPSTSSVRTVS